MEHDINSNYVDITYTVDEIHAMSKLLYKVQKDSQYSEHSNDPKCLLNLKKDQKISRNDRCEATGKKYKNCCGATI